MGQLTLHNRLHQDSTIISNLFIDTYMPQSNGEFVKIYLYLLRCTSLFDVDISLSSIADKFNHTEKDVLRALKYWEKIGLLKLIFDSENELSNIYFSAPVSKMEDTFAALSDSEMETATAGEVTTTSSNYTFRSEEQADFVSKKPMLTKEQIKVLQENEEIQQLLYVAEQYLGKILTPNEMTTILYFYDELHFTVDLIEYLIEYCVSKSSKSIRYINTVALSWAEEGITTVSKAKERTNLYNKYYFTILNAFGIKGRNPAKTEITIMETWLNEYGFTMELIIEACNRTIIQTCQPSFQYADKILTQWKKNGVKHLSDLISLDEKHAKAKEVAGANKVSAKNQEKVKPAAKNRFNNFNQRSYDYEALEKQLLKSKK